MKQIDFFLKTLLFWQIHMQIFLWGVVFKSKVTRAVCHEKQVKRFIIFEAV